MELPQKYVTNYRNTNDNLVFNKNAPDQNNIRSFKTRTEHFKQSLFSFCVNE